MATKKNKNFRLDPVDLIRLEELSELFDLSETAIVSKALDLMSTMKFYFSSFNSSPDRSSLMGLSAEKFIRDLSKGVNHD